MSGSLRSRRPPVRLVAPVDQSSQPRSYDDAQREVIEHAHGVLRVVGGPGTGKTTVVAEAAARRLNDGAPADSVLALTFGRRAAGQLRDEISGRSQVALQSPPVRSFESFAWGVLDRAARNEPDWGRPRLITGPEQDLIIRELLAGALEGEGATTWPPYLRAAMTTRGFARELRDVLMRCTEREISADQLRAWAQEFGRSDWAAIAAFIPEYSAVTGLRLADAYDPAELVRAVLDLFDKSPEALADERARLRHIYVDEAQELDPAKADLLDRVGAHAKSVVLVGDPDQSVFGFRGADPYLLVQPPHDLLSNTVVLPHSYRADETLIAPVRRWSERLSGVGSHRRFVGIAEAVGDLDQTEAPPIEIVIAQSDAREAAAIAQRLQRLHLEDGVRWQDMAVIVRSTAASLPALRRAFSAAEVPLTVTGDEVPVVDNPAVQGILGIVRLALDDDAVDVQTIEGVLCSPYFGEDALSVRRMRKTLRRAELQRGGGRSSSGILCGAIRDPQSPVLEDAAQIDSLAQLGALVTKIRQAADDGATPEELLYLAWQDRDVERRWRDAALAGGTTGAEADARLDAIIVMFDVAAAYTERMRAVGFLQFVDYLCAQDLPADRLSKTAARGGAVRVVTANNAKGLQWDVVVVANVQAERWPNLVPRGSLLGSELLVDLAAGRAAGSVDRVAQMLAEERRLFYVAISRARRRLIISAHETIDARPSRFVTDFAEIAHVEPQKATHQLTRGLSMPDLVADLRLCLLDPSSTAEQRNTAAQCLARLAADGVTSAHPDSWYGLKKLTDIRPVVDEGQLVPVSPSKVESFVKCELRWFLEGVAGGTSSSRSEVGTLVHEAFAAIEDLDGRSASQIAAAMGEIVEHGWDGISFDSKWESRKERAAVGEMLDKLAAWLVQREGTTWVANEIMFEHAVGAAKVRGAADRIERTEDGDYVVIDLKTGTTKPTAKEIDANPQLGIYQFAIESGGLAEVTGDAPRSAGAMLVFPRPKKTGVAELKQKPLDSAADPGWVRDLIDTSAAGMGGASFVARIDATCRTCSAKRCCPLFDEGSEVES
ncbi:superfamily I DNA/RNA helicase [Antricoccus suffuscus]|uniref:DNA 3'-5' helicase n=1 Tax=Antricoccus suffuscus TaxID=1629062 RepID=A0A2T0ZQF7_9ACTN|nr:ATP-dependent DNA helicase [Antricoccus suffuscus]PRZ38553.1 superfamily I DNA/RNA helicase [Antricoccus suffuscus]